MIYEVEKVSERIYRISMTYVCCYLIVGDKEAILLDAGWGYGDLKAVVESITDLPITLVLSHGHPDHIGSAAQFETAYLNDRDLTMIESQSDVDLRRRLMLNYEADDFVEDPDLWVAARTKPYLSLTEETIFDLGGVTLQPYDLPGHSAGSMVFIVPEERVAIFGDAISHPTLMFFDNSSTVREHYEALVKFSSYSDLYDDVLVNHETYEIDKIVLDNNMALAKSILEGNDAKVPAAKSLQKAMNTGPIYAASKPQRWLPHNPRDIGNIYYRAENL